MSDDLLKRLSEKPFERWALDRIETLEAALFEIIMESEEAYQCRAIVAVQNIARAALDEAFAEYCRA